MFLYNVEPLSQSTPTNTYLEAFDPEVNQLVFAWNDVDIQCPHSLYVITSTNCGVCPNTTVNTNVTCTNFSKSELVMNGQCVFAVKTEICGRILSEESILFVTGECCMYPYTKLHLIYIIYHNNS